MANNPNVNKVVYGNQTVMDITDTTAEPENVLEGEVFYDRSGTRQRGSAVIPDISNCYQTTDTAETDLQDADYIPFYDTSATGKRKTLWSNIKAKLKAFIEPFYELLIKDTVGWTGKNILPLEFADKTTVIRDVTWTVNADGSVTANGTANGGNSIFRLSDYKPNFTSGCILSGVINGSTTSYFGGILYSNNGTTYASEIDLTDGEKTVSSSYDSYAYAAGFLCIANGATANNVTFYPMLRKSYIEDSTFEGYHDTVEDSKYNRSEANVLGAKNLLPLTTVTTEGAITWTMPGDGTVVANGSSGSSYSQFLITIPSEWTGDFYFSGCPEDGSVSTYDVYAVDVNTQARPKKWDGTTQSESDLGGTSREIQIPSGHTVQIACRIRAGQTVSNLVFKPMLRLPTDLDNTFEPFAMTNKALTDKFGTLASVATSGSYNDLEDTPTIPNELSDLSDDETHRLVTDTEKSTWNGKQDELTFDNTPTASSDNPVKSGGIKTALDAKYDKALANVLGAKNLCPYPVGTRESIDTSGKKTSSPGMYLSDYIDVEGITDLTMSIASITGSVSIRFTFFNASKTFIQRTTRSISPTSPINETIVTGAKYVRVNFEDTTTNYVTNPMLRLASDPDDTYEPYAKPNRALTIDKCDNSVIAPVENGAAASRAYGVGAHFIKDGAFCTAKTAIASGETLTLNTNYTVGTVGQVLGGISKILNGYATGVNANNYTSFGFYHVDISSNGPTSSTTYGMLCVFTIDGGMVAQILITSSNAMWFRYRNSATSAWTGWKSVSAS